MEDFFVRKKIVGVAFYDLAILKMDHDPLIHAYPFAEGIQ
jgi:hypothetical protein